MITMTEAMRDRLEDEYEALERETSTIDMLIDEIEDYHHADRRPSEVQRLKALKARLKVVIERKQALRKVLFNR